MTWLTAPFSSQVEECTSGNPPCLQDRRPDHIWFRDVGAHLVVSNESDFRWALGVAAVTTGSTAMLQLLYPSMLGAGEGDLWDWWRAGIVGLSNAGNMAKDDEGRYGATAII